MSYIANKIRPVTKNDTTDIGPCMGLLVGTAGTLNAVDFTGQELVSLPVIQGYNPIGLRRIKTGGTATDLWALYSA